MKSDRRERHRIASLQHRQRNREKTNAASRSWRERNPEKVKIIRKRFLEKNPNYTSDDLARTLDQRREYALKKKYGMTLEAYNHMFQKQGGVCAICQKAPSLKKDGSPHWGKKRLAVDHNHWTGEVRGLLCSVCNLSIVGTIEQRKIDPARIASYLKGRSWDSAETTCYPT